MFTEKQLLALEEPARETLYRSIYQLYLYADKGGKLEKVAFQTLANCRRVWQWSEERAAALEKKTNDFLAERSRLLKAAGHLSNAVEPPSLH